MRTRTKLAAFGLVLAVMVGGGALLGEAVGPIDTGGGDGHQTEHVDPSPVHDHWGGGG